MIIAFVSDAIYPYNKGGKEKRLYELSTRLAKKGYDVHIYCMKWWDGPKDRIENGVHLHAISKCYPLYSGERRSIKQALIFGIASIKLVTKKFDIIDVDQMPYFPLYSTWIVCLLRHKKLYVTWHEVWGTEYWIHYMGYRGYVAGLIERTCSKLPYHINAVSGHTAGMLETSLGRTRNVSVVPNGINIKQIRSVKPANTSWDVIFAARLLKHKHADVLIEAIDHLRSELPKLRCAIVGNGPEELRLKKLVKKLNLNSNVSFMDFFPDIEDLYANIKVSKVYVLPSHREGFGIGILEANACGVPVVTVDKPANAAKELVEDGKNGSVVSLNPESLSNAIKQWLGSSREKYQKFTAPFDWDILATLVAEGYAK
jgi:glycosyltransferase involved in cell wall biosynthesis